MTSKIIPFERYAGLNPLFLEFVRRLPAYYPDPPTLDAAAARGRELLGRRARVSADAFRFKDAAGGKMAEDLASGRAVAVLVGHQVGLLTGPLFTLLKAFDAVRVAQEISARGVPAVPVFYALTDDHDLEEIAKTARPGPDGPQILILEGADRANRRPVGGLPIPETVHAILEAFREDAKAPDASEVLDFARRYAPGNTYGEAFAQMLFDLVDEPLLLLDPTQEEAKSVAGELFRAAAEKRGEIEATLAETDARLRRDGREVPVPYRPGVFPFFLVDKGERRRVEEAERASERLASGQAWASADVLSRPVLKSSLVPAAASILGPAEVAYHAQSIPLFAIFGLPLPVLLPRSHVVWMGPPERRAARALGVAVEDLLSDPTSTSGVDIVELARLTETAHDVDRRLASLEGGLKALDPTLVGSLETTRRKVAYQLEQLGEKMKKAAERKDEVTVKRRQRLLTIVRPLGSASDRLYPPLVPMLAYGRESLAVIRAGATGSTEGVAVVDLGTTPDEPAQDDAHAG
jgi:bacillithiol synthase